METTKKLIQGGEKMGLIVSEEKIKYMTVSREENILGGIINNNIKFRQYTFKRMDSFKYLVTLINCKNDLRYKRELITPIGPIFQW